MINSTERSDILVFNCYLCHVRYLLTCYVYSTKIGEISDISKCFENFVSQALGVLTRIYAAELRYIYKYSPLHNIREGVKYPATLVTTADHDDRVVPAHSFKFAAQMQHCQAGDAPVLIRIESNAGHGAGKPTSKRIAEEADTYSFLFQNIGVPYKEVKKQK